MQVHKILNTRPLVKYKRKNTQGFQISIFHLLLLPDIQLSYNTILEAQCTNFMHGVQGPISPVYTWSNLGALRGCLTTSIGPVLWPILGIGLTQQSDNPLTFWDHCSTCPPACLPGQPEPHPPPAWSPLTSSPTGLVAPSAPLWAWWPTHPAAQSLVTPH